MTDIQIPVELRPLDGRFGAGPSKIRPEQLDHLMSHQAVLGTSHRQAPVKDIVGRVRQGLADLFSLPDGYEVVLGNGGASAFWDVMAYGLIRSRSAHLSFGEFGSKCVDAARTPWLLEPAITSSEPGDVGSFSIVDDADVYAWPHNETSTGAMAPVNRVEGTQDALMLVDATSAAGGLAVDIAQVDAYYFSPQKNFASDGGLWWAVLSPAAIARAEEIGTSSRYIPAFLDLRTAIDNSRLNQTLNTPAVSTLLLMEAQVEWMNSLGGLDACVERTSHNSGLLYQWAEGHALLEPFVSEPAHRSGVTVTIDVNEQVNAQELTGVLRKNGIVDTEPYRKLGRNQIRVATFVGVDSDDIERLIQSIDFVLERLAN